MEDKYSAICCGNSTFLATSNVDDGPVYMVDPLSLDCTLISSSVTHVAKTVR